MSITKFEVERFGIISSKAFEAAVAAIEAPVDNAPTFEIYQRRLAGERDRLRLLLEINNHLVSQLDIHDLFRMASASLRSYFGSDFSGFWLVNGDITRLECVILDVPNGSNELTELPVKELDEEERAWLRARRPEILSQQDMRRIPELSCSALKAASIKSMACVPLLGRNGPLGMMSLGSRRPSNFEQEDLDLLAQISTQIALAVDNALAYGRLTATKSRIEEERHYLQSEIRSEYNFEDIVGKSRALRNVLAQIPIVAPTNSTVLLHGETGTGKELVARAIHSLSARKEHTFVRLNCAAIPSGLLESELFGHEKGAFTGALMQKRGRFEIADQGTLFLDEVGDIAIDLQPKLLRAVQEHESSA